MIQNWTGAGHQFSYRAKTDLGFHWYTNGWPTSHSNVLVFEEKAKLDAKKETKTCFILYISHILTMQNNYNENSATSNSECSNVAQVWRTPYVIVDRTTFVPSWKVHYHNYYVIDGNGGWALTLFCTNSRYLSKNIDSIQKALRILKSMIRNCIYIVNTESNFDLI